MEPTFSELALRSRFGPLAVYEQLLELASVTFFERRMYLWLISYWQAAKTLVEAGDLPAGRLDWGLVGRGQLIVNWTGRPRDPRRLVLVVHTDREGFLVEELRDSAPDEDLLFNMQHCVEYRIPEAHVGQAVRLDVGTGGHQASYRGRLASIEGERGKATLKIKRRDLTGDVFHLKEQIGGRRVSAQYVFDPKWELIGTALRAPCVDNFAGVSVATAAVAKIALEASANPGTNVSVLYTTGEEAGMVGAISLLERNENRLLRSSANTTWVVIDSSNVDEGRWIGIDRWRELRHSKASIEERDDPTGYEELEDLVPCRENTASVRLEDSETLYDPGMVRFLCQAGLNAIPSVHAKDGESVDGFGLVDGELTWARVVQHNDLGRAGMFQGGYCEASVFNLAPELMREFHLGRKLERPRCGSIVIPVSAYRNMGTSIAKAEQCDLGALLGAFSIVGSAAEMHPYYRFPSEPRPRARGGAALKMSGDLHPDSPELKLIRDWKEEYTDVLPKWQHHEGEVLSMLSL